MLYYYYNYYFLLGFIINLIVFLSLWQVSASTQVFISLYLPLFFLSISFYNNIFISFLMVWTIQPIIALLSKRIVRFTPSFFQSFWFLSNMQIRVGIPFVIFALIKHIHIVIYYNKTSWCQLIIITWGDASPSRNQQLSSFLYIYLFLDFVLGYFMSYPSTLVVDLSRFLVALLAPLGTIMFAKSLQSVMLSLS